MIKLNNSKTFALAAGSLLFSLGFFGFAFPEIFTLPGSYLFISLILGFWGIIAGAARRQD